MRAALLIAAALGFAVSACLTGEPVYAVLASVLLGAACPSSIEQALSDFLAEWRKIPPRRRRSSFGLGFLIGWWFGGD